MITHENIEIVHHFLQLLKLPFKEMLAHYWRNTGRYSYTGTHGDIRCTGG